MDNDQETPAERRAMQRRRRLSARYWDAYASRTLPVGMMLVGGAIVLVCIGAIIAAVAIL